MKRVLQTGIALLCIGSLLGVPTVSSAPQDGPAEMTAPRSLFIFGKGGTYGLTIRAGGQTHMDFPGEVLEVVQSHEHPGISVTQVGYNRVRIATQEGVSPDAAINFHVDFLIGHAYFDAFVREPDEDGPGDPLIEVMMASEAAFRSMAVQIAEPEIARANDRTREANERAERDMLRSQSRSVLDQIDGKPSCAKQLHPGYETQYSPTGGDASGEVSWRLLPACWNEQNVYLLAPFELANDSSIPFCAARDVEVTDRLGNVYPARITHVDGFAPVQDEVAMCVGVAGKARGVIAVAFGNTRSIDDISLRLNEPGEVRWLAASVRTWTVQRVIAAYTGEDWAREVARREAREARATQLIIGPRASLGACWLAETAESNNFEATRCFVLGARLVKGFYQAVAFEAEAALGWTGNADFANEARSARFGRVTLGGLLRFGEWTIPYVRLGLGAQGADYNDTGSSFELTTFFTLGGGVDVRIGNNILAGFSISLNSTGDQARALDAGLHIGYGWNPNKQNEP